MSSKILLVLLFLSSCQLKDNSDINSSQHLTQNKDLFGEVKKCNLAVDTFSFKGITLGAPLKTFKNLKKTNERIFIDHSNVFTPAVTLPRKIEIEQEEILNINEFDKYLLYKDKIQKPAPETSYEMANANELTIFNVNIDKIFLRFYSDTLYQIIIFPKSSIVNSIANKFNARNCIENFSNFMKIDLINENMRVYSESCDVLDKSIANEKNYSYLIITNEKLKKLKFPASQDKLTEKKKNDQDDF